MPWFVWGTRGKEILVYGWKLKDSAEKAYAHFEKEGVLEVGSGDSWVSVRGLKDRQEEKLVSTMDKGQIHLVEGW